VEELWAKSSDGERQIRPGSGGEGIVVNAARKNKVYKNI